MIFVGDEVMGNIRFPHSLCALDNLCMRKNLNVAVPKSPKYKTALYNHKIEIFGSVVIF
jgi:hypothetical protein